MLRSKELAQAIKLRQAVECRDGCAKITESEFQKGIRKFCKKYGINYEDTLPKPKDPQTLYAWRVLLLRKRDEKTQDRYEEWYLASHITQIWKELSMELQDLGVEVEAIQRVAPILKIID